MCLRVLALHARKGYPLRSIAWGVADALTGFATRPLSLLNLRAGKGNPSGSIVRKMFYAGKGNSHKGGCCGCTIVPCGARMLVFPCTAREFPIHQTTRTHLPAHTVKASRAGTVGKFQGRARNPTRETYLRRTQISILLSIKGREAISQSLAEFTRK